MNSKFRIFPDITIDASAWRDHTSDFISLDVGLGS